MKVEQLTQLDLVETVSPIVSLVSLYSPKRHHYKCIHLSLGSRARSQDYGGRAQK